MCEKAKHLFMLVCPCVGNVLEKFILDQHWAVLFHALQKSKAAISWKSQIEKSAKVKQILFALSPDIEVHLHQGRAKYQISVSILKPNIGGEIMMTKYWCHLVDQILGVR